MRYQRHPRRADPHSPIHGTVARQTWSAQSSPVSEVEPQTRFSQLLDMAKRNKKIIGIVTVSCLVLWMWSLSRVEFAGDQRLQQVAVADSQKPCECPPQIPCPKIEASMLDEHTRKPVVVDLPPRLNFSTYKLALSGKVVESTLKWAGLTQAPKGTRWDYLYSRGKTWPEYPKSTSQRSNLCPGYFEHVTEKIGFCEISRVLNFTNSFECYVLPNDRYALEQALDAKMAEDSKMGVWIVKAVGDPTKSFSGHGIRIIDDRSKLPPANDTEPYIVQKYVQSPLLLENRKFDIRVYVAVISIEPLVVYISRNGIIKQARMEYNADEKYLYEKCMHITNTDVQKKCEKIPNVNYEDGMDVGRLGHNWNLDAFFEEIGKERRAPMWETIKSHIARTMLVAKPKIVPYFQKHGMSADNCHTMLGVDVLLTEDYQPHFIEVNLTPFVEYSYDFLNRILNESFADVFKMIGVKSVDRGIYASRLKRVLTDFCIAQSPDPSLVDPYRGCSASEIELFAKVAEWHIHSGSWTRAYPKLHDPNAYAELNGDMPNEKLSKWYSVLDNDF